MDNKVEEHIREKHEFEKFAADCGFSNCLNVCFRAVTQDPPPEHELYPCDIRNCKHTEWMKKKKEIES